MTDVFVICVPLGLKRAGHLVENDLFFDTLKVTDFSELSLSFTL